ncbi:putative quinol monooxygenase [Mucilaginibacter sp. FT3.2]|uniref:putative quinol monooxygenase n=1 Tax=Mucilaginibacter sp. FT3.2 TaxID=2723090 RepID=UPI00161F25DB|nr:antibiotic biosynthesis monooxygenase family protein [Mucilaginibacter sp. FT3.2]MBB6234026.1 quinol monooxygenase YgiN [Mucilaginibacter sp. FT3.2]
MYPLISVWTILPGNESEATAALKNLALLVEQTQPDTLAYLVHTPDMSQPNLPTPNSGEVIFFEIYKNEAAFKAHVDGAVFKNFVATYGNLFLASNGAPYTTLQVMKHKAGYIRPGLLEPHKH